MIKRTARKRTNTPRHGRVILSGTLTLLFVAALVTLAVTAQSGVPGRDYKQAFVAVPEVGSLRSNDKVAIGGVRVGQVVTTTPTTEGARVELQLEPNVTLPADTQVQIRTNGLLGARLVQLIPGDSRKRLPDGATIKGRADALTLGVPDALDVFNERTRGALTTAIRDTGKGVLGNGARLNSGVDQGSDAVVPFGQIAQAILDRPGAAARFVPSLESAMGPLARARADIGAMLEPADAGLKPFASERTAVRDTLSAAPGALDAATTNLGRSLRLLDATRSLATAAHATLPTAPAGLRGLSALLQDARSGDPSTLAKTTELLETGRDAIPATLRMTDALPPVLPRVDGAVKPAMPIFRTIGDYACDVINFAVVVRSMTGFGGTGVGPVGPAMQFRLQAVAGLQSLSGVEELGGGRRDAYPAPCTFSPGGEYPLTPGTQQEPAR